MGNFVAKLTFVVGSIILTNLIGRFQHFRRQKLRRRAELSFDVQRQREIINGARFIPGIKVTRKVQPHVLPLDSVCEDWVSSRMSRALQREKGESQQDQAHNGTKITREKCYVPILFGTPIDCG